MEAGDQFINVIQAIYSQQKAKILINGEESEEVMIEKGTRQGCPLSPLLFIFTLETLLRTIRQEMSIRGLKIREQEYKVQAYADDLVFVLEEPLISGGRLMDTIQKFGEVAGLQINRTKTNIIAKNMTEAQKLEIQNTLGLQVVRKVKYLGIWLSDRCSSIKADNHLKLTEQLDKDLEKWGRIQLSLMGRIALIKTYVVPRMVFLFQTAPVRLDKTFFKNLDRTTNRFIWQGKKPRVRLKVMQRPKEQGGWGVPNWRYYYNSAMLVWIREWITLQRRRLLVIEGHDLQQGWHAHLWWERGKPPAYFTKHHVRGALIERWMNIRKTYYSKIPLWVSPVEAVIYPTLYNPDKKLTYKEILDTNGRLKTKLLIQEQGVNLDWWTYMQISSKYMRDRQRMGISREMQILDKILLGVDEKVLSKCYKHFMDMEVGEEGAKTVIHAWEKNLGYPIDPERWNEIWTKNLKLTRSMGYKENIYKMAYRWHLPPARLAKMFPGTPSVCWKCGVKEGTYFHQWWTCREAMKFWKKIQKWLNQMLGQHIQLCPEVFLLGIRPENVNRTAWYLFLHITTAARLAWAQYWKMNVSPPEQVLIQKIMNCAESDRLTMILKGRGDTDYYISWSQWYIWLSNRVVNRDIG